MPRYNLLIACDEIYYTKWAISLLKSVHLHAPWLTLHCHLVNAPTVELLDFVNYTHEEITFVSEDQKLGYLQAVRFLAVADKFKNNELVVTLDCDSLCIAQFTKAEFAKLFEKQYVMHHPKAARWLAGFVTFNNNNTFRQHFSDRLRSIPLDQIISGWDQVILEELAKIYNFVKLPTDWISIGKPKKNTKFITLKGSQRESEKYLLIYNRHLQ